MNRRTFLGVVGGALVPWPGGNGRLVLAHGPVDGETLVERWSWIMGQTAHLQVYARSEEAGYEVLRLVLEEFRRIEDRLSTFDPASDLAELNRRAGLGPMVVGEDLRTVLLAAERFRRLTGGGFDPAVEPLMRAWGFREARSAPPSAAELAEARSALRRAVIDIGTETVRLPDPDTRLDLGGIAVGYALDRGAALLRRAGVRRALIDLSGDCLALGAPPGLSGWRIGIANPDGDILTTVLVADACLATSANTTSVVRYPGVRCGHVLDPVTGLAASALRQVSIVAPSGLAADALSTAMLVSGRRPPGVTEVIPVPPAAVR